MVSKQIIFTLRRKKIYWAYARASCRSFKRKIDSNGKDLSKQRRFSHTSCSAAIACFLSKPEAACWQNVRLTSPKLRFRTAVSQQKIILQVWRRQTTHTLYSPHLRLVYPVRSIPQRYVLVTSLLSNSAGIQLANYHFSQLASTHPPVAHMFHHIQYTIFVLKNL